MLLLQKKLGLAFEVDESESEEVAALTRSQLIDRRAFKFLHSVEQVNLQLSLIDAQVKAAHSFQTLVDVLLLRRPEASFLAESV